MLRNLVILLAIVVAATLLHMSRESFFNIIPTEVIDPEYRFPVAADVDPRWPLTGSGSEVQSYERVGDAHGVDLNCHNVDMFEIAKWISQDDPRLMHEAVLRFDPSINPMNPNHTPRVLKLLMINLPSYGCQATVQKYLPIVRKCFPAEVRV